VSGGFAASAAQASGDADTPFQIIDSNVHLFQWPFRHLPLDTTGKLVDKLESLGVEQAWAGSYEGLMHRQMAAVNDRLATECGRHAELVPIGTIDPTLVRWQNDLEQCVLQHQMPGIRLYPGFHGYSLDSPAFGELLNESAAAGLFVQLVVAMEDTRTQHRQHQVPDVDLRPLARILPEAKGVRLQLLGARLRPAELRSLSTLPGLYFDTSRVDGTDGVPALCRAVPDGRVLYGSHAPFLVPEAALIRVHESGLVDQHSLAAVYAGNARQFHRGARL